MYAPHITREIATPTHSFLLSKSLGNGIAMLTHLHVHAEYPEVRTEVIIEGGTIGGRGLHSVKDASLSYDGQKLVTKDTRECAAGIILYWLPESELVG